MAKKYVAPFMLFLLSTLNPIHAAQSVRACLHADNISRIDANGECLAVQSYFYNNKLPHKNSKLLVFIHGDGEGGEPSDYLKYQATSFVSSDTIAAVLIRPGYYDSDGNYSTGESYAFANKGQPRDGYRKKSITTLATAIKTLKDFYKPSCTIVVGHSGGAIMSGIIMGKYPHLVNGAVLASVTYNVHTWGLSHAEGEWPHSLSPHDWITKIPKNTFIYIVSGEKDKNTYPAMAKTYYESLKKLQIPAYFITVKNGGHNSIVLNRAKAFRNAIQAALQHCPSS